MVNRVNVSTISSLPTKSHNSIIFHIPWKIKSNNPSGSQIRPLKMIEGFKTAGYKIDLVMGTANERRKQINIIKNEIKKGKKYDFLYSESSNFPTILASGRYDAIKFPLLDFRFFSFCQKHMIPIGLFYRDVYWTFSFFNKTYPWMKRKILKFLYQFDLNEYQKYVTVLYFPSIQYAKNLPSTFPIIKTLPPGCKNYEYPSSKKNENNDRLNIIYVGGLGDLYKMLLLVKVVGNNPQIYLTICCRTQDWEKVKNDYEPYLKSNINIVHVSGKDLLPFYEQADVASIFLEKNKYREFAIPIKLFEYIGHHKPIIATKDTAVGDFVNTNGVGWVIPYDESNLEQLLHQLTANQEIIKEKQKNIAKIIPNHTWKARAIQVRNDFIVNS